MTEKGRGSNSETVFDITEDQMPPLFSHYDHRICRYGFEVMLKLPLICGALISR